MNDLLYKDTVFYMAYRDHCLRIASPLPIVLLLGTNIAFATAVPLFGKPLLGETAISNPISGKANLPMRALLIFILFIWFVIPTTF